MQLRLTMLLLLLQSSSSTASKRNIKVVEDKKAAVTQPVYNPSTTESKPCGDGNLLEVTFKLGDTDKMYGNVDGFSGHVVSEGDVFEYEMMWLEETAHSNVDMEAVISNWRLRDDEDIKDQHGLVNHCEKTGLRGLATRKFYRRRFDLSSASGKHINTLVFSANPQNNQKEATMLVKDIRIVKKGGSSLEIWNPRMSPPIVRAYFPGSIETRCKSSYLILAEATCNAVDDTSGKIRNGSQPIPLVFGGNVTCSANITVGEGTARAGPPVFSVTGIEVIVRHKVLDIPALVNTSWGVDASTGDDLLTMQHPARVSAAFTLGPEECTPLLTTIYKDVVIQFTATVRDTNSDSYFAKSLIDGPVSLFCGPFHEVEERQTQLEEPEETEKTAKGKPDDEPAVEETPDEVDLDFYTQFEEEEFVPKTEDEL